MNLRTIFWLFIVTGCLLAPVAKAQSASFNFDGYMTSSDSYDDANKKAVYFYNGHEPQAYGTADNPIYQTYLRWGVGTDSSETSGTEYFFLYVETPIEVKNMIWGNAVTADDIAEYDVHYSNHHSDDPDMDFGQATGSEYVQLVESFTTTTDKKGNTKTTVVEVLKTKLKDNSGTSATGQLDVKSSLDYLLANGATEADSNAGTINSREIGMAFEYKFDLDAAQGLELVNSVEIIEYHLSPERGLDPTQVLVPEPSSSLFIGLVGVISLLRRKR
jgi:hypothetical protein